MAQQDACYRVLPEIVSVAAGVTNGVFIQPVAGQVSVLAKLISGGTCHIMAANSGSTYAAATLAAQFATYAFAFGAVDTVGGVIEMQGPATFYLASSSGACVVHLLRRKSDNT